MAKEKKKLGLKRVYLKVRKQWLRDIHAGQHVLHEYEANRSYNVPEELAEEWIAEGPGVAVPADDQNNPIEPEPGPDPRAERARVSAEKARKQREEAQRAKEARVKATARDAKARKGGE